jgi:tripartite-type tricarboxylate transporter receptor subunit TctC
MRIEGLINKLKLGLVTATLAVCASAQAGSSDLIKIVVPFAPGGSADLVARALAVELGQSLGRTVIVENRASIQAGIQAVTRAKPDGTTLLITPSGPISITAHLQKLPYDPMTELMPVAMVARVPAAVAVPAASKLRTFADLINAAKASKKTINYAVGIPGGHMHLVGELLAAKTGAHLNPIPYRGNSMSVNAAVAGDVEFVISDLTTLIPLVKGERLRLLAVTDSKRASAAPDIATVGELGFPDATAEAWIGLFGPPGLPAAFVGTINAEVKRALNSPKMRVILANAALDPLEMSPEQMKAFLTVDYADWGKIIKTRNIKLE